MGEFEDMNGRGSGELLGTAKWADPAYIAAKYPYEPGCIWLGRNPHNHDQAIGYRTEKHVFVCAETGGGKGRAFMVNNQALWPGSMITVGPKGDEATMTAIRRGQGNDLCDGLKQKVVVLDPFGSANVPDEYLGFYDLLSELQADDPDLIEKTEMVTAAACKITDSTGDAKDWQKRGQEWVTAVVQHVITSQRIKREARNFGTVRELVVKGDVEGSQRIHDALLAKARIEAEEKGEEFDPKTVKKPDPYHILLNSMINNPACDGEIALQAEALKQVRNDSSRQFIGIRGSAKDLLQWMQGNKIKSVLWKHDNGPQETFKAADLKDKKISVFICLPEKRYQSKKTWLEAMITSLVQSLTDIQGLGANGERVLFCIDEFANLGPMPAISEALNSIRSAGVSLMVATQGLTDLQENYPKNWERFPSAAGIEVYFQADEVAVGEYLEKKCGKKEVTKYARTVGVNTSKSVADAIAESYTHTRSLATGRSQSRTKGTALARTLTQSDGGAISDGTSETLTEGTSTNQNDGTSDQSNYSQNEGYGPGIFHAFDITHTLQIGRGGGRGRSRSKGTGTSNSASTGRSRQRSRQWNRAVGTSETENSSSTDTDTQTETTSEAFGKTTTQTQTEQEGKTSSLAESFQAIPLLSISEAREYLISPEDPEHPAFPGMALVLLDKEANPTFVRKSNYDQDPFFVRKFLPNPSFKFVALEDMRPFGFEITPDHFFRIQVPDDLAEHTFDVAIEDALIEGQYVPKGGRLISIGSDTIEGAAPVISKAPMELKLVEEEENAIVIRADQALSEDDKAQLNRWFWGYWQSLADKERERIAAGHARIEEELQRAISELSDAEFSLRQMVWPDVDLEGRLKKALPITLVVSAILMLLGRGEIVFWPYVQATAMFCGLVTAFMFWRANEEQTELIREHKFKKGTLEQHIVELKAKVEALREQSPT